MMDWKQILKFRLGSYVINIVKYNKFKLKVTPFSHLPNKIKLEGYIKDTLVPAVIHSLDYSNKKIVVKGFTKEDLEDISKINATGLIDSYKVNNKVSSDNYYSCMLK